jgi:hypothetical protein
MTLTHKAEGMLRNALKVQLATFQRGEARLLVNRLCALGDEFVNGAMQLDELVTLALHYMHIHCHVLGQASQQGGAHETLRMYLDGFCMMVAGPSHVRSHVQ